MEDRRNVTDEFKGWSETDIINALDKRGIELEIAIENLERDFNMGTIVRSANAFGVRTVHVVGRRQWNKRGAMMTDKYLTVKYHPDVKSFHEAVAEQTIVAVDIVDQAIPLQQTNLPLDAVLVFGAEGSGLSADMLAIADQVVAIEQLGSTRSINVGVAAGIAMYDWLRSHKL